MDGGAWQAAVHGVAKSRTRLSDFTFMHWRRKWRPTPVFLPGESQGRGSLMGCRLWGRTESDTTEATQQQQQQPLITDRKVQRKRKRQKVVSGRSQRISKNFLRKLLLASLCAQTVHFSANHQKSEQDYFQTNYMHSGHEYSRVYPSQGVSEERNGFFNIIMIILGRQMEEWMFGRQSSVHQKEQSRYQGLQ